MNSKLGALGAGLAALALTACGGGGGGGGGTPTNGGGGVVNSPPSFSGNTEFTFAETASVSFTLDVADPDGDTVTVTIGSSGDGGLFVLDTSTGVISANTQNALLNFEDPQDVDRNNIYEQTVTLSDGTATVSETVRVTITDVDEAPEFEVLDIVDLNENATGPLVTFVAVDPEGLPVSDYSIVEVSKLGEPVNSNRLLEAFAVNMQTGVLSVEVPFDADIEGTQDLISVSVSATDGTNIGSGSVSIQLLDLPSRVISGVRIAGSSIDQPIAEFTSDAGDIDDDGSTDILVSLDTNENPEQTALLILGSVIRDEMADDGAGDLIVSDLSVGQRIELRGDNRNETSRESVLHTTPACDIDGDGTNDLTILFDEQRDFIENGDEVDGPLAAVLWGDFLATGPATPIDLTALTSNQGLLIGGLPQRAARGAVLSTGNFDGDANCDLVFGTPDIGAAYIVYGQAVTRGDNFDIATAGVGEVLQLQSELVDLAVFQQIGTSVQTLSGLDNSLTDSLAIAGAGLEPSLQDGLFVISGAALETASQTSTRFNLSEAANANSVIEMASNAEVAIVGLASGGDLDNDGIADITIAYRGNGGVEKVAAAVYSAALNAAFVNGTDPSLIPATSADGVELTIANQSASQTLEIPAVSVAIVPREQTRDAIWLVALPTDDAAGRREAGSVFAFTETALQALTVSSITFPVDAFPGGIGIQIQGFQENARLGASIINDDVDQDGSSDLIFGSSGIGMQERLGNSGGVLFVPGTVLSDGLASGDPNLDLASTVIGEVP
ncbi:MAG: hypothetical protein AAAFM81_07095 [Pseudomonadota bacterium]